ncbi:MAG: orotate phosphoribosyltransferase [Panacagrimonas sp.]
MLPYQQDFIELALQHEVLRFGSFTLKSGRVSPYFFNLGRISSGAAMRRLAAAYAQALSHADLHFDMLFGPAYKGIPLVAATACALADPATGAGGVDLPYVYNRKEAKDHGEGGVLVGAEMRGRVLILDDVLTAGTAMREAITLIRQSGAEPVAALIALDREEVGPAGRSAVAEIEEQTGIRVLSLVNVGHVMQYLARDPERAHTLAAMRAYQERYGVQHAR